jgi:hypothetical protein
LDIPCLVGKQFNFLAESITNTLVIVFVICL